MNFSRTTWSSTSWLHFQWSPWFNSGAFLNLGTPRSPAPILLPHTSTKQNHYPITTIIMVVCYINHIHGKWVQLFGMATVHSQIPYSRTLFFGFCNGMLCFANYVRNRAAIHHDPGCSPNHKSLIYMWNPSIRKFKNLEATLFSNPARVALGLAYHSQTMTSRFSELCLLAIII